MRDPRFTFRVQQRFGCCSSTQVDDPDVDVRENFSGSRPRLAGAGHNPGQLFARSGHSSVELSREELPSGPHVFPP